MSGETNLQKLIQQMEPKLLSDNYVFVTCENITKIDLSKVFTMVNEQEGVTLVLTQTQAQLWQLDYEQVFSLITLQVHSSLAAVGLTAAFSSALAKENISANVIAGYFHDHILVGKEDAQTAIRVLESLKGD